MSAAEGKGDERTCFYGRHTVRFRNLAFSVPDRFFPSPSMQSETLDKS